MGAIWDDGEALLAWTQFNGPWDAITADEAQDFEPVPNVLYARSSGDEWAEPGWLVAGTSEIDLAAAADGVAYMVWCSAHVERCSWALYSDGEFAEPAELSSGPYNAGPAYVVSSGTKGIAVWFEGAAGGDGSETRTLRYAVMEQDAVIDEGVLSDSARPPDQRVDGLVSSGQWALATYADDSGLVGRLHDGERWLAPEVLTPSAYQASPAVSADGDAIVQVQTDRGFQMVERRDGIWTAPEKAPFLPLHPELRPARLALDEHGGATAVWSDINAIYTANRCSDGSWSVPTLLSSITDEPWGIPRNMQSLQLLANPAGHAVAAWTVGTLEGDAPPSVVTADMIAGCGLSYPQPVAKAETARPSLLGLSPGGAALMAWHQWPGACCTGDGFEESNRVLPAEMRVSIAGPR